MKNHRLGRWVPFVPGAGREGVGTLRRAVFPCTRLGKRLLQPGRKNGCGVPLHPSGERVPCVLLVRLEGSPGAHGFTALHNGIQGSDWGKRAFDCACGSEYEAKERGRHWEEAMPDLCRIGMRKRFPAIREPYPRPVLRPNGDVESPCDPGTANGSIVSGTKYQNVDQDSFLRFCGKEKRVGFNLVERSTRLANCNGRRSPYC